MKMISKNNETVVDGSAYEMAIYVCMLSKLTEALDGAFHLEKGLRLFEIFDTENPDNIKRKRSIANEKE